MQKKTKPLYGSFEFGLELTIQALMERLAQISDFFLDNREFNSHIRTIKGENYYGLTSEELFETFAKHEGKINTLTSSSSTEGGIGVNINIRFEKDSKLGKGQFVIVASDPKGNEEMKEMLYGIWEPRPKEEPVTEIEPLLIEDEPEVAEEEPIEEIKEIDTEPQESEELFDDSALPLPVISEEKSKNPISKKEAVNHLFHFNKNVQVDTLVNLIYDLFIKYLDNGTFDIRILTFKGDFFVGISVESLSLKLNELYGDINKLYVDMTDHDGDKISLSLSYNPLSIDPDSEVILQIEKPEEVLHLITSTLSLSEVSPQESQGMNYEAFKFDPRHFFIEEVIAIVQKISQDHLKNSQTVAFLSSVQGDHFHDISLNQLKELFFIYQSAINVLTLYLSRPVTGQSINLVFDFQNSSGSFAILMGDANINQKVKDLIWKSLFLSPFQAETPKPAASVQHFVPQPTEEKPSLSKIPKLGVIEVSPIFSGKNFVAKEDSCLILISGDSDDSNLLWESIDKAVGSSGRTTFRGDTLFGYQIIESMWTSINETEIIIADITDKPADIFYQIGIAHTLGKKILLTAQHSGDIPFDFKKHTHIIYDFNEEGLRRLRQDIYAHLQEL